MADPQLENGFTTVADELLEALALASLSAREYALVLAIIRRTYGWRKKKDQIAASQLAEATGIPSGKIWGLVRGLEEKHVVTVHRPGPGKIVTIGIQKDHSKWRMRGRAYTLKGGRQPTPHQARTYPQTGSKPTPKQGVHKRERDTSQERDVDRRVRFGKLLPLLAPEVVDAWIEIRPHGRVYSRDEVQAIYLAARPALIAADKEPISAARNLFASVKPHAVRQAVLWVEAQALEAMQLSDDRERDSFEDFAEAFGC